MSPTDALTALVILESLATDAEREHPKSSIGTRTIEHVIADNVRLQVQAQYTPWAEAMASMNTRALEPYRHLKAHLVYGVLAPGRLTALPLSRDEAVELLESRELPQRWYETQLPALTPPDEADEDGWSVTGFLASVRPTAVRDHGPARVGTQGAPRR